MLRHETEQVVLSPACVGAAGVEVGRQGIVQERIIMYDFLALAAILSGPLGFALGFRAGTGVSLDFHDPAWRAANPRVTFWSAVLHTVRRIFW